MNFSDLRRQAQELRIPGWSRMRKAELEQALTNYERSLFGGMTLKEHWGAVQTHCEEIGYWDNYDPRQDPTLPTSYDM